MSREKEFERVKELIRDNYEEGHCGLYNRKNSAGDPMRTLFDGDYFTLDICYEYSYFEIFGSSEDEFEELEKIYEGINNDYEMNNFINNNSCLRNMNEYVKENNVKNYGFEKEIKGLIKGLSKMKKSNVLLLGKAGIGKTALVEKLCELINEGNVPDYLKDKIILELSLGEALAGTRYRGEFEEKIEKILKFIKNNDNLILFIDEVHNVLGAGAAEGAIGAGDILKPFMARGNIKIIGATTIEEYSRSIKKNKAMDRRFSKLLMKEPDIHTTINILKQSKKVYENYYNVSLNDKEIILIVFKCKHKKGCYPDKAFDELEDYCYEKTIL